MIKSHNTLVAELSSKRHRLAIVITSIVLATFTFTSFALAFKIQIQDFAKSVIEDINPIGKKKQNQQEDQNLVNNQGSGSVNIGLGNSVGSSANSNNTENSSVNDTNNLANNPSNSQKSTSNSGATNNGSNTNSNTIVSSPDCAKNSVWQNLETCGWPGPSNTGPSGSLTLKPDGMTISESGTYTNLDVRKYLNINASNVTVRNFKLSDIVYGYTALRVDPGVINVVLEDCEINPNFVTQFAIWGYDNITVRRCEIYRNGGAIQARQNVVFEDNYCHDIDDVANDGDDWHTNCVIAVNDSRGVSNWRIYHNSMRLGTPGGLQYLSGVINTLLAANNTIENNLIANGAYSMYLFDTRSANVTPTNTIVKNNRFSTVDSPKVGIYGIWYPGQGWDSYKSAVTFSGNTVLETGKSVDAVEP